MALVNALFWLQTINETQTLNESIGLVTDYQLKSDSSLERLTTLDIKTILYWLSIIIFKCFPDIETTVF